MTAQDQQLSIGARVSGELVMFDPEKRRRHLHLVGQTWKKRTAKFATPMGKLKFQDF
jgi:hypothetical protein